MKEKSLCQPVPQTDYTTPRLAGATILRGKALFTMEIEDMDRIQRFSGQGRNSPGAGKGPHLPGTRNLGLLDAVCLGDSNKKSTHYLLINRGGRNLYVGGTAAVLDFIDPRPDLKNPHPVQDPIAAAMAITGLGGGHADGDCGSDPDRYREAMAQREKDLEISLVEWLYSQIQKKMGSWEDRWR